jgi:mannosyltransferase
MQLAPEAVTVKSPAPSIAFRTFCRSDFFVLSAICVLGVFLRFYHISYLSLWGDEVFSRFYYQTGLRFMWTEGLHSESSPPLYYMAVGAWVNLFGSSEAALRSLSAVASTAAIPLVYVLGRELFDRKHGLIAAALFALSAAEIYYAQEARSYALLLIPLLVMLIACARYALRPGEYANVAIYVVAAIACIYTHTTMFLLVAACGLAVFVWLLATHGKLWNRAVAGWIAGHLCIGVLVLPALVGMLDPVQWGQLGWIPPVSLRQIGAVFSNTVAGTLTPGHFPGGILAGAVAVVLAISIWRGMPSWRAVIVILAIPGVYTASVIFVSISFQPILLSRVFCWAVIPLCLIEAHAVQARGWLRPIAIGVIVGTLSVGLYYQLSVNPDAKEPWRESIQYAATELQQADLVVLSPDMDPAALLYYAPNLLHVAMWRSEALAPSELGIMPRLLDVSGITLDQITHRINDPSSQSVFIAKPTDDAVLPQLFQLVRPPDKSANFQCRGGDNEPTNYPCGIAIFTWRPSAVADPSALTDVSLSPGEGATSDEDR